MRLINLTSIAAVAILCATSVAMAGGLSVGGSTNTGGGSVSTSGATDTGPARYVGHRPGSRSGGGETSSPGEIASVGEPFLPFGPTMPKGGDLKVNPERPAERLPCFVDLGEDGEPQVNFSNQSGIDYPQGTVVKVTFSNGEIGTYTYANNKFNDGSDAVVGLPLAWMPPLTCTIDIVIAENLPH